MTQNTDNATAGIDAMYDAIAGYVDDGDIDTFRTALRAIHGGTRNAAQGPAIKRAMDDGLLDMDALGDILGIINDLPTSTSRVERRVLTDDEVDDIRYAIDMALSDVIVHVDMDDDFVRDALGQAVDRVRTHVARMSIGTGSKARHGDVPTDYVAGGSDIVGRYKGAEYVATLNSDDTVTYNDTTYKSVSAAAGAIVGRAQNGWNFWRYEGVLLANHRDG